MGRTERRVSTGLQNWVNSLLRTKLKWFNWKSRSSEISWDSREAKTLYVGTSKRNKNRSLVNKKNQLIRNNLSTRTFIYFRKPKGPADGEKHETRKKSRKLNGMAGKINKCAPWNFIQKRDWSLQRGMKKGKIARLNPTFLPLIAHYFCAPLS